MKARRGHVVIGGHQFKVVENLGFNHSVGHYAKVVEVGGKERVIVRVPGEKEWRWHKPAIRFMGPVIGQ